MQNGNLRADVNVSVCLPGQYEKYQQTNDFSHLGIRCEIKNMNSMRFIQQAIEVEARRQIAILEAGGKVEQETRLYDPDKSETRSMRSKEKLTITGIFPILIFYLSKLIKIGLRTFGPVCQNSLTKRSYVL